jgi:hypothetical protein
VVVPSTVITGAALAPLTVVEPIVWLPEATVSKCGDSRTTGIAPGDVNRHIRIWGSPLYVDGHLYVGNEDGDAFVFDLGAIEESTRKRSEPVQINYSSDSREVWKTSLFAPMYAPPIYANGVLYFHAGPNLCAVARLGGAATDTSTSPKPRLPDAVFVPTPPDVVERMLELAQVKKTDLVVDLGSGDGRIVLLAASKYGAQAVGYEIDPILVEKSRQKILASQLKDLVRVEREDFFKVDLEKADVVALYLPARIMDRLLPQLKRLKPGARIVSHEFVFSGVPPDKSLSVRSTVDETEHHLHLWTAALRESPNNGAR